MATGRVGKTAEDQAVSLLHLLVPQCWLEEAGPTGFRLRLTAASAPDLERDECVYHMATISSHLQN